MRKFGFHGIRHLAAGIGIGIDAGANILDVQQLLRHKSSRTTERYIHRIKKENRAVDALDGVLGDAGRASATGTRPGRSARPFGLTA